MANDIPKIELFVKAALSDRKNNGASLVGQQWFMTLYALVEKGIIELQLTPVALDSPPVAYTNLHVSRHLPVAWIKSGLLEGERASGLVISSIESFETLLVKLNCPNLSPKCSSSEIAIAEKSFEDLYIHLMQFIKNDTIRPLMTSLSELENYLSSIDHPYLLGSAVSYSDCQLMPKLQHVRIAGRGYKNFDIPANFTHIWRYIKNMYQTEAFIRTCPFTRDVLMQFDSKLPLPKEVRPSLLGPGVLTDIPEDVANGLANV